MSTCINDKHYTCKTLCKPAIQLYGWAIEYVLMYYLYTIHVVQTAVDKTYEVGTVYL